MLLPASEVYNLVHFGPGSRFNTPQKEVQILELLRIAVYSFRKALFDYASCEALRIISAVRFSLVA